MPITITDIVARDIRFPTSLEADGSDAIRDGRYRAPVAPGYSIEMRPASLADYAYPDGPVWTTLQGR